MVKCSIYDCGIHIAMADCYDETIGGSLKLKGVGDGGVKK